MPFIKEILLKRYLIKELVAKDLKLRYSRPAFGFLWAFLSPFLTVVIFYIIFSLILRVKINEAPFIPYLMSGVFSWKFFQDSVMGSVASLVDYKNLIKESNFSHYFIPLSIVLACGINFLPSLGILIISALLMQGGLPMLILWLPLALALHLITAIGASILFSILYVKWRDIRYILEAALTIVFYLTPVFYSIGLVKETLSNFWYVVYIHNPFVGILNLYRITILKDFYPAIKEASNLLSLVVIPSVFALILLYAAFFVYQREKKSINDYLAY